MPGKYLGSSGLSKLLTNLKSWAVSKFSQLGHQHSAGDISSGTLPVSRGGTGQSSLSDVTVGNATKVNGHSVAADVPAGAKFTDTDTNTTYTLAQDASDGHKLTLTGTDGYSKTVTIPDNNTTYSSKTAASGGTELSLVTTGEKATWNAKTSNAGTVTSVATGTGLTGGTITGSGTVKAKLRSETALANDSAAATETSGRVYPVAVDKSGYLAVNVPWVDTNTQTITGVKGNAETAYRTGQVNLTPANIGASASDHTHSYLPLSGGTLTGAVTFANNTYNTVGDDAQFGDISIGGAIGVKGKNGATRIRFVPYSGSTVQDVSIDGAGNMTVTGNVIHTGNTQAGTSAQATLPTVGYVIHDVRNVEITNNTLDRAVNFFFSNKVMPDSNWWSVMHMRGWTGGYASWELAGTANASADKTKPLYVRTGSTDNTWGSWRKIYDTSNKPSASDVGALPLAGGTMTGILSLKAGMYDDGYSGALNANNSDIYGVNSIYTADVSDGAGEGIHFYRDATHVDTLWMNGGDLLFVPNRAIGTSTTKANSQKVARFTSNPTSGKLVATDGTTGGVCSTGILTSDVLGRGSVWLQCDTAAGTSAKVVPAGRLGLDNLLQGLTIQVTFANANTVKGELVMRVGNYDGAAIYVNGEKTSATNYLLWAAKTTIEFTLRVTWSSTTPTLYWDFARVLEPQPSSGLTFYRQTAWADGSQPITPCTCVELSTGNVYKYS